MKTLCVLFTFLTIVSSGVAQVKIGPIAGYAPARSMGTAQLLVNRNDPASTFIFNGNNVEYSPSLGLMVKFNTKHFFFEADPMYYSIRKSYTMQYLHESVITEKSHKMEESCKSIELPLSAGVKLGYVEIKSGFSVRYEFGQSSSLSVMEGYQRKIEDTIFGWHTGIGVNFGKISAELRYQQDFGNYGQGIYVNDQELLLKNSPTQLRFLVGLMF